jgi:hypothetical protein
VYVEPFFAQVTVTGLGEATRGEEVAVRVVFAVTVTSTPAPVLKRNVGEPVVTPTQPAARLTVKARPVD